MTTEEMLAIAQEALADMKAQDVVCMNVGDMTDVTDYLIIASGTSNRHVRSLAENVELEMKKSGVRAIGVEGAQEGEWILADFGEVIVHAMLPATREFYDLEKLWSQPLATRSSADSDTNADGGEDQGE
jgi:ribosome-associated protein